MKKPFREKPKNQIPNLEHLVAGEQYALNFNPAFTDDIESSYNRICRIFDELPPYAKFAIHFELSPTGRLHVHGYITPIDIAKFYCILIPYLTAVGTVVISRIIDDGYEWEVYINKQKNILEPYFKEKNKQFSLSNYEWDHITNEGSKWMLGHAKKSKTSYEQIMAHSFDTSDLEYK